MVEISSTEQLGGGEKPDDKPDDKHDKPDDRAGEVVEPPGGVANPDGRAGEGVEPQGGDVWEGRWYEKTKDT